MRINRLPRLADSSGVNIMCIGDTHCYTSGIYDARLALCRADIQQMFGYTTLDAIIQLGDQTNVASQAEFDKYLEWKAGFVLPGVAFGEVPGNHDLIGNNASGTPDIVTPAQWAAIMGQPSKDRVIDLPGVRILLVAPAANGLSGQAAVRRLTVDVATVNWIDARCAETSSQVVIAFHAPLPSTVGPLDGSAFSSYDERWRAHWDAASPLSSMLARNQNIVAWVSGHTHSRVVEVDVVKSMTYGTNTIAAVSASSPSLLNPGVGPGVDQVASCMLTVKPDRVEVRYRDHGMHQWLWPTHTVML